MPSTPMPNACVVLYGPERPKAGIVMTIMSGFQPRSTSYESPMRSITSAEKLSMTTSLHCTRRRTTSCPSGCRMSTVILNLLRAWQLNMAWRFHGRAPGVRSAYATTTREPVATRGNGEVVQRFHTNDFGATVGQHHRGIGSGIDIGEIGDADAFKRQWKHGTASPEDGQ